MDNSLNINENKPVGTKNKTTLAEDIFDIFECFVFSLIVVFFLFSFVTRICIVSGRSMEDTLYNNEKLFVTELLGEPERGDIIVFHQTGNYLNESVVKRVIATEGEWVDISVENKKLKVTVYDENMENPQELEEEYAAYKDSLAVINYHDFPVQVPDGCLFVMGDNRNHSTDSRSAIISFVDERRVLGKVILRVWPFDRFGLVD